MQKKKYNKKLLFIYTKKHTALILGLSSNPVVAVTPVPSLDCVSIVNRDLLTFLHQEIETIKFFNFLDYLNFNLFFVFIVLKLYQNEFSKKSFAISFQ